MRWREEQLEISSRMGPERELSSSCKTTRLPESQRSPGISPRGPDFFYDNNPKINDEEEKRKKKKKESRRRIRGLLTYRRWREEQLEISSGMGL